MVLISISYFRNTLKRAEAAPLKILKSHRLLNPVTQLHINVQGHCVSEATSGLYRTCFGRRHQIV